MSDRQLASDALSKVPAVTLGFWIIKILATTLGETGGDTVSMSWLGETTAQAGQSGLNGYLVGTTMFGTTGWIRRTLLKRRGVAMSAGVEYDRIDDAGLHIRIDGKPQLLEVDTIVICAGQEPRRELVASLEAAGIKPQLIGGADVALELDAKRAIDQGTRVALAL